MFDRLVPRNTGRETPHGNVLEGQAPPHVIILTPPPPVDVAPAVDPREVILGHEASATEVLVV